MKTIKDAYEELNGDLSNSYDYEGYEEELHWDERDSTFTAYGSKMKRSTLQYICTVEEFNNYKPEKENKVDCTSLEFWKDAPEDATHYINDTVNSKLSEFVQEVADKSAWKAFASLSDDGFWSRESRDDKTLTITPKPRHTQSPVFTQEMADNGVLPSVGMEFMWHQWASEELKLAKMLAISGGECWIEAGDASFIVGNITGCKPITPHITLIDGKAYQFDCDMLDDGEITQGIYRKMNDKFYSYNGDFGVEYCANIQPLTVGVK